MPIASSHGEAVKQLGQAPHKRLNLQRKLQIGSEPDPFFHGLGENT